MEIKQRSCWVLISHEGLDGANTALANIEIGHFHYKLAMIQSVMSIKRKQLLLGNPYAEEAVRIVTKTHNPTHLNIVSAASVLSDFLRKLSTV
jgi:hypothetical protein